MSEIRSAISIIHCNVNNINFTDLDILYNKLPGFMQSEVKRYKREIDRKTRLLARIMLLDRLTRAGHPNLINLWQRSENGKPFIEGWEHFSISHSGNYVVLCHGPIQVGVDIEEHKLIDIYEMMPFLNVIEQRYVKYSADKIAAFYQTWVKKEAYLKAIGKGIIENTGERTSDAACIASEENKWQFCLLDIATGYTSYLCAPNEATIVETIEFNLEEMFMHGYY